MVMINYKIGFITERCTTVADEENIFNRFNYSLVLKDNVFHQFIHFKDVIYSKIS